MWSLLQWSLNACFFLHSRSSILNLLYLCNFGSLRSKISSYGSPLSPLSNPTGLIKIGFFKKELCPISHDDLIIDWFSSANLYEVPRVTIATFGPKNDTQKNYSPSCFYHYLRNLNPMLREKVMMISWTSPVWHGIWDPTKTLTSSDHISKNIANQDLKFDHEVHQDFSSRKF